MSFFNATKKVAAVLGFAAGSVFARGLLLAATAVGAVLMFGCGGDDNPGGGGAISDRWINGAPLTYGNQTYRTVKIGGKTWMAENLNYASSSGSWCYDDDNSNCAIYGRLYNWETAKTVCPSGWHLPSREEWGELAKAAGGTGTYGDGGTAGTKLKSKTGWNDNGNGTDEYGFSALPGGCRYSDGSFRNVGNYGYWWTTAENGGSIAYDRRMNYGYDNVGEGYYNDKSDGSSVRCLRD